jgi:PAS domain S-box-containing protein
MVRFKPALEWTLIRLQGRRHPNGSEDERSFRDFHLLLTGFLIWAGIEGLVVVPIFAVRKAAVAGILLIMGASAAAALWLLRHRRKQAAAYLFLGTQWCAVMGFSSLGGGIHREGTGGAAVIILGAGWLLGRSAAFGFAAATLLLSLLQALIEQSGHPFPVYFPGRPIATWSIQAGIVVLAVGPVISLMDRLRKQVSALRENQRLLHATQRIAGLGSYVLDIPSGTWKSSPVLDDMFGIDAAYTRSLEGWLALIHPECREQMTKYLSDPTPREGLRFDTEYRILRHRDGRERWVHGRGEIEFADAGKSIRMVGTILDITERKRTENALKKSTEQFVKMFRGSPDVVVLSDVGAGDRIVDVNDAFANTTGYGRDEAVGRTTRELGLWADDTERAEFINRFRADGRVSNFEFHFRRRTGDIGVGLVSSEPIELDGKRHRLSVIADITKQRTTEEALDRTKEALMNAETHYRRLFDSLSDASLVFQLEKDGLSSRCIDANDRASYLLGYTREELLHLRVMDIDPPEDHHTAPAVARQLFTHGHSVREQALVAKDGRRLPVEINSHVFDLHGAPTMISCIRDVSERKQAEAANAKLEEQFRQAQKLESVGRLAGGIAHDFNNLLTIINGYTGFLLKELNGTDPLRSYAEQIGSAGQRAAGLTRQLLAFSRKQVIQPRVLDLNTIVKDAAPLLQRLIGEDISFRTHQDPALGQVMADPVQIHQVVMNLAVNARDAMPDGGILRVETANVELDGEAGAAVDRGTPPGRYVLLTVTDTGCGMDETTRRQIFEPFFTTKEVGKGTGLGLATVYGIVRQSAGWIDVRTEVGVGTSFQLYFPRIDAELATPDLGTSAPAICGGETILVVEDQTAVRGFISAALNEFGYRILEASGGEEAFAIAHRDAGPIHLLLTDVVMPGMKGKELSERLTEAHPNLKTLFMTGYGADVIAHRGVLDPGVAVIYKPFSPDELAGKVREVLSTVPEKHRLS